MAFRSHASGMLQRCIIADDNPHYAKAARVLLEREGLDVVATATPGPQAVELVPSRRPDLVILDIDLGVESGFEVARQLSTTEGAFEDTASSTADGTRRAANAPDIILVSTHDAEDFADLIAESDAVGFLAESDLSLRPFTSCSAPSLWL